MQDSVFTRIIKGEIPAHKIYEDDKTLAIMDIHPVQNGMVIVTTKEQVVSIEDLNEDLYQALWATVRKVVHKLRETFPEKRKIAIQVEGLDIPHVHIKLFPINSGEDFRKEPPTGEPDHSALAAMAERLKI